MGSTGLCLPGLLSWDQRRVRGTSSSNAAPHHLSSTRITQPFINHLSLAMWPQTIFCLKSHPNLIPTISNSFLVKKNWYWKDDLLVTKKWLATFCNKQKIYVKTSNFTVKILVDSLLEGREIRKKGSCGIFMDVFTCRCLPFSRQVALGVSQNIHWILPTFSVGVFEMWERKRLTDL